MGNWLLDVDAAFTLDVDTPDPVSARGPPTTSSTAGLPLQRQGAGTVEFDDAAATDAGDADFCTVSAVCRTGIAADVCCDEFRLRRPAVRGAGTLGWNSGSFWPISRCNRTSAI